MYARVDSEGPRTANVAAFLAEVIKFKGFQMHSLCANNHGNVIKFVPWIPILTK